MKKSKTIAAALTAVAAAVTISGCTVPPADIPPEDNEEIIAPVLPDSGAQETPDISVPEIPEPEPPKRKTVTYLNVLADGVNIRSGAGTGYSVRGSAEKSTMYALDGSSDGWYKTGYKNKSAYISSKYCKEITMLASEDERIEAVIAEGAKLLGTAYVFGAVRYHDGSGRLLKDFTTGAFDCSSLMQYIFYKGAAVNLHLTTRTQIYQGKTVTKSQLIRGDLMF